MRVVKMITVMLADDHQFAVEGLSFFLSSVEGVNVIKTLSNGHDVLPALIELQPNIIILDMGLPGMHGLDVLRDIKSREITTKIVVLTGLDEPSLLKDALLTGAEAVLTKVADTDEILKAIMAVNEGSKYVGNLVQTTLDKAYPDLNWDIDTVQLTKRENEVLLMIASGKNSQQISVELDIAEPTVRKHRQNLMEKLGLHNSASITSYVLKRGLNS